MLPKSQPQVWRPSPTESAKLIQTGCEVSALSLKSGAGAGHIEIYDAKDANGATPNALVWVLDCSTTDNDNQSFGSSPLIFRKGVYAICTEGLDFNPILCVAALKYN